MKQIHQIFIICLLTISVVFTSGVASGGNPLGRPSPDLDEMTEKEYIQYQLYANFVSPTLYAQMRILEERVKLKFAWEKAITNLGITLFNQSLSLKSALNPNLTDMELLTLTLGTELDFLNTIGGTEISGIVTDTAMAAVETSLGDPSAFAAYCATHLVQSGVNFYGAFQFWQLRGKINQSTAINDLMYSFYALGQDIDVIIAYYDIPGSGWPAIVQFVSDQMNVDKDQLNNDVWLILRYMNEFHDRYTNYIENTPSAPERYQIQNGVNPSGIVFSWSASSCKKCGTVQYNLEIHQNRRTIFKADEDLGHLIQGTSFKLPVTLKPNTPYDWAVFPKNQYGNWNLDVGDFSRFTTGGSTANHLPSAAFSVSTTMGDPSTIFSFDASDSNDPDGDSLGYQWNWGEGAGFFASGITATHQYTAPGTYTVTLRVNDGSADSHYSKAITVTQPQTPPLVPVNPHPSRGDTNQAIYQTLNWADGGRADSYEIYFGTRPEPGDNPKTAVSSAPFDPGPLAYDTTYYWRVDAINAHGTTIGDTWYFTTQPPPAWLFYHYWDFDTTGTEGWTARNAESEGIYNQDYWIIDPFYDPASKSGIISAPDLRSLHTGLYGQIEVRAGVKNAYIDSLEAHLKIDGTWQPPFVLSYVSGIKTKNSQCLYQGIIPYSGAIEQVRIDVVIGSDTEDDRVYIDRVTFIERPEPLMHLISGYVTNETGEGIPGVNMAFTNGAGTVLTNNAGYYEQSVPEGWSGTVFPSKPLYTVTPAETDYDNVISPKAQHYTAHTTATLTAAMFDSGTEGISDGVVFNHGFADYPTIQASETGSQVGPPEFNTILTAGQDRADSGEYYVYRAVIPFDTSSLPENAVITGATLYLYGYDADYSDTDFDLQVVRAQPASHAALIPADYSELEETPGGSLNTATWQGHNGVNPIRLTTEGISWINTSGITCLGLRSNRDINQTEPHEHEFVNFWSSQSNTDYRPVLEVEYQAPDINYPEGIQGRILDQRTNETIQDAQVSAGGTSVQSSDNGQYLLDLGPGDYEVTVSKTGYQTITRTHIQVPENTMLSLDIELPVSLYGIVTDQMTAEPVMNVDVSAGPQTAKTNTQGVYTLGSLVPGIYDITFEKCDHLPLTIPDVEIIAGQSRELNVELPLALAGTVTDYATGQPISNVIVSTINLTSTQTDPQGRYGFGEFSPGVYDITFAKTGYQTATIKNVYVSGTTPVIRDMRMTLPGPLNIITPELPAAETENPYNPSVRISGGTPPYSFTLSAGKIPPGCTLDAVYGNITGTPDMPGSYTFTVRVTDTLGAFAERQYSIDVTHPLVIETGSRLPNATKDQLYQTGIAASGGTKPYQFSYTGDLPLDLYFTNTGNIRYKVTDTVDFNSNVLHQLWNVSSGVGISAKKLYFNGAHSTTTAQIQLFCPEPGTISFDYVTDFVVGYHTTGTFEFYIDQAKITDWGGSHTGRYTTSVSAGWHTFKWRFDSERSNQFVTLDNITFPVNPEGNHDFTVTVTDTGGRSTSAQFQLRVLPKLDITTDQLNNGIAGAVYNQQIIAAGGTGNYTWAVYAGTLPDGMALDPGSGALYGTPAETAFGTVVLFVTDENGTTVYKDVILHVADPLSMATPSLPDGLAGTFYSEAIQVNGGILPCAFSYYGMLPDGLSLDQDTGIISGTPTHVGYFNVIIVATDSSRPATQSIIRSLGINITGDLTITTPAVLPRERLGSPVSPVVLNAGGGPSPYVWTLIDGALPQGISLNPDTGEISGTPRDRGDFVATVQVTDGTGDTAVKTFYWHIADDLVIETRALPDGAVGAAYNFTLTASGGEKPYEWRIKSGTLPDGLSLNRHTGTISGVPAAVQTFSITVEANDSASPMQTTEKTFTVQTMDDLVIFTPFLPKGRLNAAYTATISAVAGTPPYDWRLESGSLPPGLDLESRMDQAVLSGEPLQEGTWIFTLAVTDSGTPKSSAFKEFRVDIAGDLHLETQALASAERGIPYSETIDVTDGDPPYVWQIVAGSLPAGLTLNSTTGHISGITHLSTGQSTAFTVQITDSGNPAISLEQEFAICVADPLTLVTEKLQKGLQKSPYAATLEANGGISPYFWTITDGVLPEGLSLNPNTGVISGTLVRCGTFDFTVWATGSAPVPDTAVRTLALEVICCDACYVISGNAGGMPGVDVSLEGDAADTAQTDANGDYAFSGLANGQYTVVASTPDDAFIPAFQTVIIQNQDTSGIDFAALSHVVDVDGNGAVDLQDAIVVLQVMAGIDPAGPMDATADIANADMNNDGKTGMQELIVILQTIADVR